MFAEGKHVFVGREDYALGKTRVLNARMRESKDLWEGVTKRIALFCNTSPVTENSVEWNTVALPSSLRSAAHTQREFPLSLKRHHKTTRRFLRWCKITGKTVIIVKGWKKRVRKFIKRLLTLHIIFVCFYGCRTTTLLGKQMEHSFLVRSYALFCRQPSTQHTA